MHSHREGKSAVVFLLFYRNCYHLFLAYGDLPFLKSSWIIPTGQGREWHGTKTLWHLLHRNSNGDSVILTMICWSTVLLYIYTRNSSICSTIQGGFWPSCLVSNWICGQTSGIFLALTGSFYLFVLPTKVQGKKLWLNFHFQPMKMPHSSGILITARNIFSNTAVLQPCCRTMKVKEFQLPT